MRCIVPCSCMVRQSQKAAFRLRTGGHRSGTDTNNRRRGGAGTWPCWSVETGNDAWRIGDGGPGFAVSFSWALARRPPVTPPRPPRSIGLCHAPQFCRYANPYSWAFRYLDGSALDIAWKRKFCSLARCFPSSASRRSSDSRHRRRFRARPAAYLRPSGHCRRRCCLHCAVAYTPLSPLHRASTTDLVPTWIGLVMSSNLARSNRPCPLA